ncbi:MAG: radical SAM protein [bacterium]|nr:radical SAM protein [bacterium]
MKKIRRYRINLREIRINLECNQDCPFCNTDEKAENVILDEKSIRKKIKTWSGQGIRYLSITGREPTLYPGIIDLVKWAGECGYRKISLQTNALLFSDKNFGRRLKEAGLNDIFISFHSCREKNYNRITRSRTFRRAVSGIKNILTLKIETTINIVVNSLNYKELPDLADFISRQFKGTGHVTFSFVAPAGKAGKNRWIIPRISLIIPYLTRAIEKTTANGINVRIPSRCGFPVCFLPAYSGLFDDLTTIHPWNKTKMQGKIKTLKCRLCRFNDRCSGFWKDYVRLYGFK